MCKGEGGDKGNDQLQTVGQEEEDKKTILAKLNELEKNGNYMLK
jgi:hypothetical protein